jgi:dimethylhistidine N-methyltransferase
VTSDFRDAVVAGLRHRPAVIPARYLYDAEGSHLFEAITALPEYYPTRTETAIFAERLSEIAALAGPGRAVVEFGSGSSAKTPPLLRALGTDLYVPVDISPAAIEGARTMLADAAPDVRIEPVVADFLGNWAMPQRADRHALLGFFPGSTIGNMGPRDAVDLLRAFRERLGTDSQLLIGLDLRKDPDVLRAAYNDSAGVTASFNLNLLTRMQRELDADLTPGHWRHCADWRDPPGRIEMHLKALRPTAITIGGEGFAFREGETIHTENSWKFSPEGAAFMARASGWEPVRQWTDPRGWFMVALWSAAPDAPQP